LSISDVNMVSEPKAAHVGGKPKNQVKNKTGADSANGSNAG
jgi:hypothetical protein